MTLRELLTMYPRRFYPQVWYEHEGFLDEVLHEKLPRMPDRIEVMPEVPLTRRHHPRAVQLADLYLRFPDDPLWQRFLWCADTDDRGQRLYVGGVEDLSNPKWQIHRHLALSDRWAMAIWGTP